MAPERPGGILNQGGSAPTLRLWTRCRPLCIQQVFLPKLSAPSTQKLVIKIPFSSLFFLIIEFSRRKFTNSARLREINTVALYETAGLLYEHANPCLLSVLPSNGTRASVHQKHRFRPLEQMLASDRRKPRKKTFLSRPSCRHLSYKYPKGTLMWQSNKMTRKGNLAPCKR